MPSACSLFQGRLLFDADEVLRIEVYRVYFVVRYTADFHNMLHMHGVKFSNFILSYNVNCALQALNKRCIWFPFGSHLAGLVSVAVPSTVSNPASGPQWN